MNNWKKCKLGDVAEITSSKRIFLADYVEGGVPFYRSKEIIERSAGKEISNPLFISNEKYQQIVNKFGAPQYGEMLLTSVGTLGIPYRVSQTDKFYFKDGNLTWFRKLKDISCDYLYYFFLSPIGKEKLETITIGSTQKALTIKALQNLDISLPSMEEQKRIAGILGSLDDKIELLQKQDKTLEDMAKAIFKSWFVDFDVVHAKQKGLPKADIMREYHLTDELYDLFPSDFENSSLGPIPLGWQVSPLGHKCKLLLGGTPAREKKEYWQHGTIAWINSGKVNDFRVATASEYITKEAYDHSATKMMPPRTTIIAITGATLGAVSMTEIECCANQSVVSVLGNQEIPNEYIYLFVKQNIDVLLSKQTGGAQQHINKNDISNLEILCPSSKMLLAFLQGVKFYFDKISNNLKQIQTLTELRDTLLPPLISGKIRV